MKHLILLGAVVTLLCGCASREARSPAYFEIEPGNLPTPDVALTIPGLGPCTDNPDRTLRLNSSQPVNVLVHGCFGSSGGFRGLSQVLAFQGQQTACFTYDDRAALTASATDLRRAINQLIDQTQTPQVTLIGHSQGALISRKSATELPVEPPQRHADLQLVTISGPFDGIASAQTCGKTWLHWATLGFIPVGCYLITGDKWNDITDTSPFIRTPGELAPSFSRYLKIDTDERNTCRREESGRCLESDYVFSLEEQHNRLVEQDQRTTRIEVRAGHVEIVGDRRAAPLKLITVLQEQGIIRPTPPERQAAFLQMLSQVYLDASQPRMTDRKPTTNETR